jgi:hypothetical protein
MTKCPKSQNCRPTYFSVVASVMMELESVGDENFESWSEGTPNFYGFCISVCFNFFAFLTISTIFSYTQFPSVSGSFCSTSSDRVQHCSLKHGFTNWRQIGMTSPWKPPLSTFIKITCPFYLTTSAIKLPTVGSENDFSPLFRLLGSNR